MPLMACLNQLKDNYHSNLAGKPERPEVDSVVQSVPGRVRAWRISWATKSHANVTEYRLLYRKIPVSVIKPTTCALYAPSLMHIN